jgi:hypothetical protein
MLMLRELRDDQINRGCGEMFALLIDAGQALHLRRPVMHHETDVLWELQAETLQPAGNVCVEGDECIRLVLLHPLGESVEALADVIAWKQ